MLGGRIEVVSVLREGATFTMIQPRRAAGGERGRPLAAEKETTPCSPSASS